MKYALILAVIISVAKPCSGQGLYYDYGYFPNGKSTFFHVPINTKVILRAAYIYGSDDDRFPYPPSPVFFCDSTISIKVTSQSIAGSKAETITDSLLISITLTTARAMCYGSGISGYLDSDSDGYYEVQGVFFDPNVIGKISAPDSLYFNYGESIPVGSKASADLRVVCDSIGQYHPFKVLSVDEPFSIDSVEMIYPCQEFSNTSNCTFLPTAPGHYVDTAKLLDELTGDTISVVLIGDVYDAGVSEAPEPQVKLYPNPCDRELNIEMPTDEPSEIEIRNVMGEDVYSSHVAASAAVDCSQFPGGIYFVSFVNNAGYVSRKFIVSH